MTGQKVVLPPRVDLKTRREQVAASAMARSLGLVSRLARSRALVEVAAPVDDPFYRVPDGLDRVGRGEVLETRQVEVGLLRRQLDVDAWQVKFRSTDTSGAAVAGVTTLMVPRRRSHTSVRPLLSYQAAIDSLGAESDPSYTLRRGNQWELAFMALALGRGWAVVATDYTGPRHAFAAGIVAGRFVLDGIRAALSVDPALLSAATPIGLWGYSGGAQATLAAAEQHPVYAPELNIVGAAAGGITFDPTTSGRTFEDAYDRSVVSGIPFGGVIGISRESSQVDLLGSLTEHGRAMVAAAADMTTVELALSFPFLHYGDYLSVPTVMDIPGLRDAFEEMQFGRGTPSTKLYLYQGILERNVPVGEADEVVERYRSKGTDVTYQRVRLNGHMTTMGAGAPGALRFLSERFASA